MADSHVHRLVWLPSRRAVRLAAIAVIVFGPIASAACALHGPEWARFGDVEIDPETAVGPAADSVREYLAARDPVVDRLLPDGAGGTRFFEDLDGNAGMAFLHASAVGISATAGDGGWPEATELHERAHLLYASLPEEASRLIARLAAPAPGEYAAKKDTEHVAEMAATAWEIVAPPKTVCVDGTPVERLRDAETRVPGTAAFVAWYLRNLRQEDVEGFDEISRTAARLVSPYRAESDAVWKAVEARRLSGGGFRPWGPRTVRDHVEGMRAELRVSRSWIDRVGGHLLLPSLAVLSIAGR